MSYKKTGSYFLRPNILTAVIPVGVFLVLVENEGEGVQVEVLVHPDFRASQPDIEADAEKPCGTNYDCHYRKAIIHDSRCPKFRTA